MIRWNSRALLVVALTVAALLVLLAGLAVKVGRPYPGFFVAPDFRVFPAEPGVPLQWGDRIVSVEGGSPITLVVMLVVGVGVFVQNPRARPNRNFLISMCLWAVSNVVPESVLGSSRLAACLVGFISIVLSVHGWVFFLTYPANPPRELWLERHRVIPRLYAGALALGSLAALTFVAPLYRLR